MTHRLIVPAIHVANTIGMLDSMDPELARERIIIIDNTADQAIATDHDIYERVNLVWGAGRNLGVAASWNEGARLARDHGADYVTLTSSSMRFTGDGGRALALVADFCAENTQWPYGFESLNGWHLITLTQRLFDEVGPFDEEFFPAYFEDNDFIWRMRCAGIIEPAGAPRDDRKIPWVPTLRYDDVGQAHAIKNVPGLDVDLEHLAAYYKRKWLGPPGSERTTTPFHSVTRDAAGPPPSLTGGMSFTESM